MAAASLNNYVEKFKVKKVDGAILSSLDDEKLRVSIYFFSVCSSTNVEWDSSPHVEWC